MTRSLTRELRPAIVVLVLLTVLTGIGYPLAVTAIGQVLFPSQANGSMVMVEGRVVGSMLIGQPFSDPRSLWGRPSAAGAGYDANASAGSNLAATSQVLVDRVTQEVARLQAIHGDAPVPVELVTTSGSGLDPHLSPAAAAYQVGRIAAARGIPPTAVQAVIDRHTERAILGLLGTDRVNVLAVNLDLDRLEP